MSTISRSTRPEARSSGATRAGLRRSAARRSAVIRSRIACSRWAVAREISWFIRWKVSSHDRAPSAWSTSFSHSPWIRDSARAWSQAATNSTWVEATFTASRSPKWRTTSMIGVETTGRPAARYSGVLVGLMKRVDSLMAKGIKATSQPDR